MKVNAPLHKIDPGDFSTWKAALIIIIKLLPFAIADRNTNFPHTLSSSLLTEPQATPSRSLYITSRNPFLPTRHNLELNHHIASPYPTSHRAATANMKLTFKDLKQQKFTIEAEPSETIGQVKAKISAEKGWEASTQKLIYSGKILQDDNTIESYKIEEKGFIVCMTSKVCFMAVDPSLSSDGC